MNFSYNRTKGKERLIIIITLTPNHILNYEFVIVKSCHNLKTKINLYKLHSTDIPKRTTSKRIAS